MTQFQHTSNSNRSRQTVRLPVTSNEHINSFTGADVSNYSGYIYNGIIDFYSNEKERHYVTERPAVKITNDASDNVSDTKGRGIYYWPAASTTYFVNAGTVYKGDYTIPCAVTGTALTSGTEKVYFQSWNSGNEDYLFIINPEGNQIFVIANANSTIIINMDDGIADTGTGAPFHASDSWDVTGLPVNNSKTLCHGAVNLDTYLFLGCKDGTIWNSNVDNWLNWNALDFITAERENDQLLYIDKTRDHIAAFGERSIELFYDAGNPTASPLSVRKDIAYRTGIASGQTAWSDGDDIHFLGMKPSGDFGVFTLGDFQLAPHQNSTLESYLRHSRTEASLYTVCSGVSTGGHTYFILTLFDSNNNQKKSVVYDSYSDGWYEWETTVLGNSEFPLMGWSIRTPEVPVTATGIFSNGDIFQLDDNFIPIDKVSTGDYYFAEDYLLDSGVAGDYMDGYVTATVMAIIPMKIVIDNFSSLSSEDKFMHSVEYAGSKPVASQNLIVEWSDNEAQSWLSETIDICERTQINRLGRFKRRRFRLNYSGDEQIRIEGIDVTFTQGS